MSVQSIDRHSFDEYITVAEAANLFKVSQSTVWRWIDRGEVPAYRIGQKGIRIRKAELSKLVNPARSDTQKGGIMGKEQRPTIPTPNKEELARRQTVVAKVLANAQKRNIAPLSAAELVRKAREENTFYESNH